MAGLLGDDRHRLDRRRTRADHGDALAGEIHGMMRPMAGMIDFAFEFLQALDVGHPRVRKTPGGEDDMARGDGIALRRRHRPQTGGFIEYGALDAGRELNVAAEVKTVGDVVGVFQDLGLRRVPLAPVPLLLQFVGKRIGILHALDVAARARIPVPVPGTADAIALLVDPRGKPEAAQPVQHVHAGKPRADHHGVIGRCIGCLDFA